MIINEGSWRKIAEINNPSVNTMNALLENKKHNSDISTIFDRYLKKGYQSKMTEKMLVKLIDIDPSIFQYIKNPSEELQIKAIRKNPYNIKHIKNPSPKVKEAMLS